MASHSCWACWSVGSTVWAVCSPRRSPIGDRLVESAHSFHGGLAFGPRAPASWCFRTRAREDLRQGIHPLAASREAASKRGTATRIAGAIYDPCRVPQSPTRPRESRTCVTSLITSASVSWVLSCLSCSCAMASRLVSLDRSVPTIAPNLHPPVRVGYSPPLKAVGCRLHIRGKRSNHPVSRGATPERNDLTRPERTFANGVGNRSGTVRASKGSLPP